MLPDFFVIGAQKAGSTYLLECLGEHPQVFMPPAEVAFFEDPLYARDRLDWFEQHFAAARPGQVVGVKRPNVLGRPECPARLAEHLPEARLIVVLREPIERAVSAYFHYMKTGLLPVEPLESGLRKILQGPLPGYPRAGEVLEFGLYARCLARFEEHFAAERLHLVLLDDIRRDAQAELSRVYQFLGVDANYQPQAIDRRPMGAPYSLTRLRLWNALDEWCRVWTPDRQNYHRRGGLLFAPLVKLNQMLDRFAWQRLFAAKRPRPSSDLLATLADYYREDLERLEQRLGRDLSPWKAVGEGGSGR